MSKGPGLPQGFMGTTGSSNPIVDKMSAQGGPLAGFFGKIMSGFMPSQNTTAFNTPKTSWSTPYGAAAPEGMTYSQWKPNGEPPQPTQDPNQISQASGISSPAPGGGVGDIFSALKRGVGTSGVDPFSSTNSPSIFNKVMGTVQI